MSEYNISWKQIVIYALYDFLKLNNSTYVMSSRTEGLRTGFLEKGGHLSNVKEEKAQAINVFLVAIKLPGFTSQLSDRRTTSCVALGKAFNLFASFYL
jgi:hypothetical protein